ncbi:MULTISPECIES: hypothetical protein [unclassified Streptomyces]|uniref:hypothetical protein n=1 Tax=unclassified Streptomyces TaxID=2593676 RepID=UPI0029B69809|nr:hypothetical protein [Streptomyces sp. DK15]MDX2389516.1 hypothetical protein [Streptomyces sp. DK15]
MGNSRILAPRRQSANAFSRPSRGHDCQRPRCSHPRRQCTQAFAELAHRGRPAAEILPLLAHAADRALLGFSPADLWEQARAISGGEPYVLRVTVT